MKKYILLMVTVLFSSGVYAERIDCGIVSVESLLSGPRHGSMMKVTPACPGTNGWVCLDPDAEHMSVEVSKRLYAQVLSFHVANKSFELHISTDLKPTACGSSYPTPEDLRTPE